ncbi:MAG: transglutaminase-like domain-containing protein, partial [Micrococcaceae bacterium]|nr:transglutaminase-like domain-containing protein [Micrococcaceae bacterium]
MSAPASWRAHLPSAHRAIDAVVLLVCLGLGVLGLHAAFGGDVHYLLAGIGGVVLGLVLAHVIVRYRWGFLSAAGVGIAVYLIAGTPLATPTEATSGFLPNFESLRTLLAGVVLSWKDVLTVAPPVGLRAGMLVVPFLSAYVTALLAGLLAWRFRSPFWATIPVAVMFIVGIIFGTRDVPLPLLRGLVLVMALVCWLAWRRQVDRAAGLDQPAGHDGGSGSTIRPGLRRIGSGAVVLMVAGGLTAIASPALDGGPSRQVLRDAVVPPVDLYDYPSPLMSFRNYAKDNADEPLLSVTGLPEGQRVRLAALDSYDGMVFDVDPRSGGNFTPVGDVGQVNSSAAEDPLRSRGSLDITIEGYHGVWLPAGGKLLGLDVAGERSEELARSLFYNDDAETALSTTGLRTGDSYTAAVEYPVQIDRKKLQDYGLSDVTMPKLANVPQVVSGKAAEMAGDEKTGVERAAAMEGILHETGYFSNGKENEVPSLSGHGAARIASLLDADSMIGDDEQYAAAMALMARDQGMPARVVMGFYPEKYDPAGTVQIKGEDVHAWVEIEFENVGWVAFTPTPAQDNEPPPPPPEHPNGSPPPGGHTPPPPP